MLTYSNAMESCRFDGQNKTYICCYSIRMHKMPIEKWRKNERNKNRIRDKKNTHVYAKFTDDDIEVKFHHTVWLNGPRCARSQMSACLFVHRRAKFLSYFNPNVLERYCYFYCVFIRWCVKRFFSQSKTKNESRLVRTKIVFTLEIRNRMRSTKGV